MAASLILGVALLAITEFLSFFALFNTAAVYIAWIVVTIGSVLAWYKVGGLKREGRAGGSLELTPFLKVLLASVLAIIVVTGLIALIAPTNNWDSMTYHMARVVHWIQNQSVAHYPTNILRQVAMPPWAEFAIAHLQIMSGGDRLANLVQWSSMIGSVLGVTLIAARLGATARAQVYSAVIAATVPMGIVQASSTQNDYVLAFWLVGFVYYGLRWKERPELYYALAAAASLALAILTKGTAYLYALPFLLWFFFSVFRSIGLKVAVQAALMALLIIVINSGHYTRNMQLFGSPVSSAGLKFSNEVFGFSTLISNLSRNLAIHVATPSERVNKATQSAVVRLHSTLGTGASDPRTTWEDKTFFVRKLSTHEDRSQNPLHFILILAAIVLFLSSRRFRGPPEYGYYAGMLVLSFIFFCFYLKWQPWHSRLHLPLFVLWSPFVALSLARVESQRIANSIVVILLLASLPWLFYNELRPIIAEANIINTGRVEQYFKYRPHLMEPYIHTTDSIIEGGCTDVGIKIGYADWEYPFWVLLNRRGGGGGGETVRIEHVKVDNPTAKLASAPLFQGFKPCYLISW